MKMEDGSSAKRSCHAVVQWRQRGIDGRRCATCYGGCSHSTQINEWSQEVYVESILPDGTELGRVWSERSEQSVSAGSAG